MDPIVTPPWALCRGPVCDMQAARGGFPGALSHEVDYAGDVITAIVKKRRRPSWRRSFGAIRARGTARPRGPTFWGNRGTPRSSSGRCCARRGWLGPTRVMRPRQCGGSAYRSRNPEERRPHHWTKGNGPGGARVTSMTRARSALGSASPVEGCRRSPKKEKKASCVANVGNQVRGWYGVRGAPLGGMRTDARGAPPQTKASGTGRACARSTAPGLPTSSTRKAQKDAGASRRRARALRHRCRTPGQHSNSTRPRPKAEQVQGAWRRRPRS